MRFELTCSYVQGRLDKPLLYIQLFPQLQYLSTVSLLPYLQETSKQWVLQHHRVNYFWMRFVSQVVIVGLEGLEPPDSEENAFTERPATNYGL